MAEILQRASTTQRIPVGIWAIGFVSMLMDISSEMIHAVLPVYMVAVFGASALTVGVIEGVAEGTTSVTKVFSGALSDWLGKRKLLAALGYGLAACAKPIFPLAVSVEWLFAARFLDRVGKGIRGAPRDALVADIAPAHLRAASYGLRQSLDVIGALAGPLLAVGLMWMTANHFRTVLWIAVIPAVLSVGLVLIAVKEPKRPTELRPVRMPLHPHELRRLGSSYWWVLAVAAAFMLARFSEAFLVLRAQSVGVPMTLVPVALVVMCAAFSLSAYPVGVLSGRIDRVVLLAIGIVLLIVADLTLALAPSMIGLGIGLVLWGLHMGFTQGLFATMVADAVPAELRGTAFGIFSLVCGAALFFASTIAGALWVAVGPEGAFLAGAAFAAAALVILTFVAV